MLMLIIYDNYANGSFQAQQLDFGDKNQQKINFFLVLIEDRK